LTPGENRSDGHKNRTPAGRIGPPLSCSPTMINGNHTWCHWRPSAVKEYCSCPSTVAVLRGPSWPFVALRGLKVLQLPFRSRSSSRPYAVLRGLKVLQLPFRSCSSTWPFVALRGQKVVQLPFCSCRSSWPFVALRGLRVLQLPFRSCSSSWPFVVLSGPSWTKGVAVALPQLPFFMALRGAQKGVLVGHLRQSVDRSRNAHTRLWRV